MDIAIIGAGISGLGAAWALQEQHRITIYEKEEWIGGHSHTVHCHYDDGYKHPVDAGFVTFNPQHYPNLTELFKRLDVPVQKSPVSVSVSVDEGRLEYRGTHFSSLFSQPGNLCRPSFLRLIANVRKFNRTSRRWLENTPDPAITLGAYLEQLGVGAAFLNHYLTAMLTAIWSTPAEQMRDYPALMVLRVMRDWGLLGGTEPPQWYTVGGGSEQYVSRLTATFHDRVFIRAAVHRVTREGDGLWVTTFDGNRRHYDQVIMAVHPDDALMMLNHPTLPEEEVLDAFPYVTREAVLHRDGRLMPRRRKLWSGMNLLRDSEQEDGITLTYWMNALQNLPIEYPAFLTVNPIMEPRDEMVIGRWRYAHPVFNERSLAAQKRLADIQGVEGIWYCGAWQGNGFHEDGLTSGLKVAKALGGEIPWW